MTLAEYLQNLLIALGEGNELQLMVIFFKRSTECPSLKVFTRRDNISPLGQLLFLNRE